MGLDVLTFDDLPERALTQDIEDEVFAGADEQRRRKKACNSLAAVIWAQPVIDIKNVIIVLIVVPIVVCGLAGLCEHAAGVVGGLISKVRIADVVCLCDMSRERSQRLEGKSAGKAAKNRRTRTLR